jgi:pimeloyl-ACP methyl ester carboxylesterase
MNPARPIVLIHGLWMTPASWDRFRSYYEERGQQVIAPGWPRLSGNVDAIRRDPSALAGLGLREIVDHYTTIIRALDEPPILIGHSIGGLTVQVLLDRGLGAAGVAISAPAPRGIYRLPLVVIKAGGPVLSNPLNYGRTLALTYAQFRYAFANGVAEREARAAYERDTIPGPARPLFQLAFANLNPWTPARVEFRNARRAPLLLICGDNDHLAPAVLGRINYRKRQRSGAVTEYKEFRGRSHLIVEQTGWEEVAEYALTWAQRATYPSPAFATGSANRSPLS